MIKNKKASASLNLHPKADAKLGSIGAPMPGEVLNIAVQVGDKVAKGQIIATLRYVFYSIPKSTIQLLCPLVQSLRASSRETIIVQIFISVR